MNNRYLPIIAACGLALLPIGPAQATDPIRNVERQAVSGAGVTPDQVRRALMAAGALRGWTVSETAPGTLRGVYTVRTHMAEVTIPYSATDFSIRYTSSADLDYGTNRAGEEVIHRNYNRWVNNLREDALRLMPYFGSCGD